MIITTVQKRLFFPALVVSLMVSLAACNKPPYTDTNNDPVTLVSDKGLWVALNFWAEWCDPCRAEIPELNELAKIGAIRVMGVDFDGSQGDALQKKVTDLGIQFPVLRESPLEALGVKAPQVLPATYILNPQGEVVDTLYGPQTRVSLENYVRKLQEKKENG